MSPSVFTIPPGESFVDALAAGLMEETAGDPLALSAMLILLPTRRACRALREAFLRRSAGRPLLLPRLRPLGDADEEELALSDGGDITLPPAVPPLRRQLLLARLILGMGGGRGGQAPGPEQAVELAGELGRLLDQVHTEGLDFGGLAGLVPADYATHWQLTLDFLSILTSHWPAILAEQGWMEAALRRNQLLDLQADRWLAAPPTFPVLAAGSTGSIPATARLLTVVAGLPTGRLVLPGLDRTMDPASRAALDQTHPQSGLYHLLDRLDLPPEKVALWPGSKAGPRDRLISETMRPAATTEAWRHLGPDITAAALAGITRLDCAGPREEAGAIALMMRETLETDERTAALVTPDRDLARRVAADLRRYGIEIDDSAGTSLGLTPVGAFLALSAQMVADDFAPHATLAALKHPLAMGGLSPGAFRTRVRRLERQVLRGPRPGPGVAGLIAALAEKSDLRPWLSTLAEATGDFATLMGRPAVPLADLLRAHIACAERLADDDQRTGAARLWKGEAGEAAADFIADLALAADVLPAIGPRGYPGLLAALMTGIVVRPAWGGHPRLAIWGPLEARLQHADRLILGGLNEGCWPPDAAADPWMSRPMRKSFGLPLPERRIGLAAHDFAQAFAAPEVILTRAARIEGAPTVPSRWLLRLDAVLQAAGIALPRPARDWLSWQEARDRPDRYARPAAPAPTPPVAARPRELSATAIETWMRDPYAVYARKILGLDALDPIDADPGAADYGTLVHGALDAFIKAHPRGALPATALEELLALGRGNFAAAAARPGLWAFWWPRFERVAGWFIFHEAARRHLLTEAASEISGALEIAAPGGPFRVTAKADRIDRMADGTLAIIDYKTGAPPTAKEVAAGYAPQLPIEAAIARHGGFPGIPAADVGQLLYWRLSGSPPGGEERSAGDDALSLAEQALVGLAELIARFDDESTPYAARPHPEMAPKYSDYLHLARVKEWSSAEEGEE
ncbi:double-strand break repair protein AddB [Telmatospirillum siberiense]|uniref:Double-strand break repair protein AddB n=1 Tax=Telmatospirillum siberiense TaxID=382514 RepID=A0A2N3PM72_9PROT|nr:double-strand break repair protein AddB [Telmatospirillum siberiense]PKU21508.1 double-strand break repair protein AddB [Telmatospirillum siberiense]